MPLLKLIFYALLLSQVFTLSFAAQRAYIVDEDVPIYSDLELSNVIGKAQQGTELLVGIPTKKNPKALPTVSEGKIVYVREKDTSLVPERDPNIKKELTQYRAPGSVDKDPKDTYYTTIGLSLGIVSFKGQNFIDALAALYPVTGLIKRRDHFPFPKFFAEGHSKDSYLGWQIALSLHYNDQDVISFKSSMIDFVLFISPLHFLLSYHLISIDFSLGLSILPFYEVYNPLAKRRKAQTGFLGPMIGAQVRWALFGFELQAGLQFARYFSNGVKIINEVQSEQNPDPSYIKLKRLDSHNVFLGIAYRL